MILSVGKILRPGEVPPEFLPQRVPTMKVRAADGSEEEVVIAVAVLISPQVQQALYQVTRAATLDALKDFHASMARVTAAALDPQQAMQEAEDEKTEPEEGAA